MIRGLWIVGLAALLGACTEAPDAQVDYAIEFNLRCSTCNDFLSCRNGERNLVFRIHELSFWQQVATIADYLTFSPKTKADRRLTVYDRGRNGITVVSDDNAMASIDTVAGTVITNMGTIDQRDGSLTADGDPAGVCATMPRREGFLMVREFLGRPMPGGT